MNKNVHYQIENAKKQFRSDLLKKEYSKITSDDEQLQEILSHCYFEDNAQYVDIGTGRGYVAFEIAKNNRNSMVTGIDIVKNVLELNNQEKSIKNIKNIEFIVFDGITLPFNNQSVTGMFARYSFHHFPNVSNSMNEIDRVLHSNGFFYLIDPLPDDEDDVDFSNKYSKLRPDGHIRYYTESEYDLLFQKINLDKEHVFYTKVTIPRKLDEHYVKLLEETPEYIKQKYNVIIDNEQVKINITVGNILYKRRSI